VVASAGIPGNVEAIVIPVFPGRSLPPLAGQRASRAAGQVGERHRPLNLLRRSAGWCCCLYWSSALPSQRLSP